jgi:hypothetical protein
VPGCAWPAEMPTVTAQATRRPGDQGRRGGLRQTDRQQISACIQRQIKHVGRCVPPLLCRIRGAVGKKRGRLKSLSPVYLGVAATDVAYLLVTNALSRISATTAVSICLVEPLTAFCLAILVIGERPPALAFAELALVGLGLGPVVRTELRIAATIVA